MTSHLARRLLHCLAEGLLPATEVQALAAAAWKDGWGRGDNVARRLAGAGNDGKISGHIMRDIMAAANAGGLVPRARPYSAVVPGAEGATHTVTMFLPHEQLPSLVPPDQLRQWCFSESTLSSPTGLGSLMQSWSLHPDVVGHNVDTRRTLALGLHCDGCQYTSTMRAGGAKSVVVMSFNVISAQAPRDRATRHLLCVLSKRNLCDCGCSGFHTYQAVWRVLVWSLRCLLSGVAPSERHDSSAFSPAEYEQRLPPGEPIPKAALLQLRGDWEWFSQCFRFRMATQESFCWMCEARQSGPLTYKDFSRGAQHRSTIIDHAEYMRRCSAEGQQPCGLFSAPGVQLEHIVVDSMHSADLGCFADALGSLFYLEISSRVLYDNRKSGLRNLNLELLHYYRANPQYSSVVPLALSQIRGATPGYPFLKAKAAQTRHLAEFGLILAQRHKHGDARRPSFRFSEGHHMAPHLQHHLDLLVEVFRGMTGYVRSLSAADFDPSACKEGMLLFLRSMLALHDLWRRGVPDLAARNALPFHLRPKAHLLHHLVEDQLPRHGSPSSCWCYSDESFVGCVKKIAAATKDPRTLESRVCDKAMLRAGRGLPTGSHIEC